MFLCIIILMQKQGQIKHKLSQPDILKTNNSMNIKYGETNSFISLGYAGIL